MDTGATAEQIQYAAEMVISASQLGESFRETIEQVELDHNIEFTASERKQIFTLTNLTWKASQVRIGGGERRSSPSKAALT